VTLGFEEYALATMFHAALIGSAPPAVEGCVPPPTGR
jgi:hypothetical protein